MSTRSLTAVKINGEYKIAQYGHYDGYPAGQGVTALQFLIKGMKKEKFITKLERLRFAITEQEDRECIKRQKNIDGAEILKYVQNRKDNIVANNLEFAQDNLLCEWAYLIDFDDNSFEVYSARLTSRKYGDTAPKEGFESLNLLKKYNLNNLPSKKEFINDFDIL